jgi:hypothetical protein
MITTRLSRVCLELDRLLDRYGEAQEAGSVEVFRMRNHNLPIEEDPVDLVLFDGLTVEQKGMLRAVVDDTVWYDMRETEGQG